MRFKVLLKLVKQVRGDLITFFCLNKTIPRLDKPEAYSLFIVDYGLYPLYLHVTARIVSICSCTVTETFNTDLYEMKRV
jgi:hypothetical protein